MVENEISLFNLFSALDPVNMDFFDTHAHLSDPKLREMDTLFSQAKDACIKKIVSICTDLTTLEHGLSLKPQEIDLYLAAATGPNEVHIEGEYFWPYVQKNAQEKKLIAIGETGLDLYWDQCPLSQQKEYFARCLDLALLSQLPVIIHCRDAFKEVIDCLDRDYFAHKPQRPVLFHCFAYGVDEMQEVIKRGGYVSFGGLITYKSATYVAQAAKAAPSDRYVIETDSPYLTPGPKRNRINQPAFVPEIAGKIAELRECSLDLVAKESFENACNLFGLQ